MRDTKQKKCLSKTFRNSIRTFLSGQELETSHTLLLTPSLSLFLSDLLILPIYCFHLFSLSHLFVYLPPSLSCKGFARMKSVRITENNGKKRWQDMICAQCEWSPTDSSVSPLAISCTCFDVYAIKELVCKLLVHHGNVSGKLQCGWFRLFNSILWMHSRLSCSCFFFVSFGKTTVVFRLSECSDIWMLFPANLIHYWKLLAVYLGTVVLYEIFQFDRKWIAIKMSVSQNVKVEETLGLFRKGKSDMNEDVENVNILRNKNTMLWNPGNQLY